MIFPTKSKIRAKFGKIFILVKLPAEPHFHKLHLDKFEPIFALICGNFKPYSAKPAARPSINPLKIELLNDFKTAGELEPTLKLQQFRGRLLRLHFMAILKHLISLNFFQITLNLKKFCLAICPQYLTNLRRKITRQALEISCKKATNQKANFATELNLIGQKSTLLFTLHRIRDKKLAAIAAFLLAIFVSSSALAIESVDSRKKIATSRNRKFYRTDRAKKVLGFNGYYGSDYNSRSYEIGGRYLFQDNKFIHELILQYDLEFSDSGSGKNKKFDIKTKDEYDGIFSSKIRMNETPYYSVFFHRTIYDRLSTEYYDVRNALGLGRMFFDDKLELDLSGGHQRVKSNGDKFEVVASLRFNKKLTDKMSFSQRGFLFVNNGSLDNKLMTSLTYRLENKVSFEIRHDFSTRRYDDSDNIPTNRVARSITIGLVFDLS